MTEETSKRVASKAGKLLQPDDMIEWHEERAMHHLQAAIRELRFLRKARKERDQQVRSVAASALTQREKSE